MSIAEHIPWMQERLWPVGDTPESPQVFALLDGAQDKRIEPMARLSGRDYASLYSGWLKPALRAASPYLVHLSRDGKLTRDLLQLGWGRSWGMLLTVPPDSGTVKLRSHLRRFLRVLAPWNKRLVFRYYDPRVLRYYLPSCKPEELKAFFGPMQRLIVESAEGDVLEYTLKDGQLLSQTWSIGVAEAPTVTRHAPVGREGPPLVIDARAPLRIRQEQLKALAVPGRLTFATELAEHLRCEFPARTSEMSREQLLDLVLEGLWRAHAYGMRTHRDAARYVQLMMHYGKNFDSSPRVSWACIVLHDASLDGPGKIDRLFEEHVRLSAPKPENLSENHGLRAS
jgi:hypothetical protein